MFVTPYLEWKAEQLKIVTDRSDDVRVQIFVFEDAQETFEGTLYVARAQRKIFQLHSGLGGFAHDRHG